MLTHVAFKIARRRVLKGQGANDDVSRWTASRANYLAWREAENMAHLSANFDPSWVAGRDVLEFGCGEGFLASAIAASGARSVLGLDMNPKAIADATQRVAQGASEVQPTFRVARDPSRIDADDASFDLICSFDVMEHVSEYRAIIREWHRVLRTGGRAWIVWQPYRHPYGHHLTEWAPLPWGHLILGQRRMLRIAERIIDEPAFRPPYYDVEPDGSRRNRFRGQDSFGNYLNDLTTGEFERIVRETGLLILRRQITPVLARGRAGAVTRLLVQVPWLKELFIAQAAYELERI